MPLSVTLVRMGLAAMLEPPACHNVSGAAAATQADFELVQCCGGGDPPAISEGAPKHWRLRRDTWQARAFEGLRVVLYGKLDAPSADTITRVIAAGGGTVVKRCVALSRAPPSAVQWVWNAAKLCQLTWHPYPLGPAAGASRTPGCWKTGWTWQ